jgi:2'-5' RNA ligase
MRLFVALDLPPATVRLLEELQRSLRPLARIRWSPAGNLHITTKFIGEWPEARLDELKTALAGIPPRGRIAIRVGGLGFFPNPRAPRVFWCGIEEDACGLAELAAATDRATAALGVPAETRPFSPHLTLARIKERLDLGPLHRAIAGLQSLDFGAFDADSFFLYHSQLRPAGSVYTKLAEFPLS